MMTTPIIRTYQELSQLETFEERFNYLKLDGVVGRPTFGQDRYICQKFYKTDKEWLALRDEIIIRDNGCDLGVEGHEIELLNIDKVYRKGPGPIIIIHHMNPITVDDIIYRTSKLLNPDYLISTAFNTHQAIHYGDESILMLGPVERRPGDTCPWKR